MSDSELSVRFRKAYEGVSWETAGRTITTADILNFAGVSGDFARLHVDEEFAKSTVFGRTVAHGLLTLIVTTTLAAAVRAFPARASYGYEGLRFVAPVFPGDTVTARVTVGGYEPKADGNGLVGLYYETSNQHGRIVMVCTHVVLVNLEDVFPQPEVTR